LIKEMQRAEFLVMPSTWYEGFPVTLTLSFASGLPVIASRLGAMGEIVEHEKTGLHFTPGDARELAKRVRWAVENPERMREMGRNAWRVYKEKFSSERNYEMLMEVYESAIGATA
jgi:glycosyltransferase involved in cell wall biosynthesis